MHGIESIELNGTHPLAERTANLDQFRKLDGHDMNRLLLLSNVGMEGMNIHCANVLILPVCIPLQVCHVPTLNAHRPMLDISLVATRARANCRTVESSASGAHCSRL